VRNYDEKVMKQYDELKAEEDRLRDEIAPIKKRIKELHSSADELISGVKVGEEFDAPLFYRRKNPSRCKCIGHLGHKPVVRVWSKKDKDWSYNRYTLGHWKSKFPDRETRDMMKEKP